MTEKELKKLNRYQLLELIIMQTEEIDALKRKLEDTAKQLESQQIRISQAGSIAEAALQINDIFQIAQSSADLYVQRIKQQDEQAEAMEAAARQTADELVMEARKKAEALICDAEQMIRDAQQRASALVENAERHAADVLQLARSQSAEMLEEAALSVQKMQSVEPAGRGRGLFGKTFGK